jgi:hypothetical protein
MADRPLIAGIRRVVVTLTFELPPDSQLEAVYPLILNGGVNVGLGVASWLRATQIEAQELAPDGSGYRRL